MPYITQILLPKRSNLGQSYGQERYGAFHARVLRRFGGWTRKGQVEGAWLNPAGKLFIEEHWVYEIGHLTRDLRFGKRRKNGLRRSSIRKTSGSCSTKDV